MQSLVEALDALIAKGFHRWPEDQFVALCNQHGVIAESAQTAETLLPLGWRYLLMESVFWYSREHDMRCAEWVSDKNKHIRLRNRAIRDHRQGIEEINSAPLPLVDAEIRLVEKALRDDMKRYHEIALQYLENGGDVMQTIDALDSDELLAHMASKGYHVCFSEDVRG